MELLICPGCNQSITDLTHAGEVIAALKEEVARVVVREREAAAVRELRHDLEHARTRVRLLEEGLREETERRNALAGDDPFGRCRDCGAMLVGMPVSRFPEALCGRCSLVAPTAFGQVVSFVQSVATEQEATAARYRLTVRQAIGLVAMLPEARRGTGGSGHGS